MRVLKVGGRAQEDARLAGAIAEAWRGAPGTLCVVHGGGEAVSALQRALGGEPRFVDGRRVTTESDVELVRMALSGAANKRLVSALLSCGVAAVGVSGEDGGLLGARVADGGALGRVGTPERVDARLVRQLLAGGFLPVVSPVGRDVDHAMGAPLNVNGDDAAAALAAALGASELLLVSDVEGVLLDGTTAAEMDDADARRAIAGGTATGGMVVKLEAAMRALRSGVPCVRIGSGAMLHDGAAGTAVRAARAAA